MVRNIITFARPFTIIPPILGVLSGALTALGSASSLFHWPTHWDQILFGLLIASLAAGWLNAGSNGLNQIYDLDIDRVNKPDRPLPQGVLSMRAAWILTVIGFIAPVAMVWVITPYPGKGWMTKFLATFPDHQCFFFFFAAAFLTTVYSVPKFGRTKNKLFWANLTIAVPRGLMLKLAGWSVLAPVTTGEPWFIGGIFFFFVLGASSTKDFSDMEGDRQGGAVTLPIKFGVRKAAYMIAPFMVLPWFLIIIGTLWGPGEGVILTGSAFWLRWFALSLIVWGAYVVFLMIRNPDDLSRVENHPSWKHMYLMMMWAQVGFALAYLLPEPF